MKKFVIDVRNDDYVLRDHRVYGVRIMPGVTFLDIILRILNSNKIPIERTELRNIVFSEAVATTDSYDNKILMEVDIHGESGGVTGYSQKISGERSMETHWSENISCQLATDRNVINHNIDVESLKRDADKIVGMEDLYSYVRSIKIEHYEFMKGLGVIFVGDGYLLAEIYLGDLAQEYLNDFYIHPAYLDCSTLIPLMSLMQRNDQEEALPYIPLYIEKFRAFKRAGDKCYVYVERPHGLSGKDDIIYNDMMLYDAAGDIVASFQRLAAKRIRSKELITKLREVGATAYNVSRTKTIQSQISSERSTRSIDFTRTKKSSTDEIIINDLRSIVAKMLDRNPDDINSETGFYDLGLDSTQLLKIVRQIEAKLGEQLYPTLLFEYTNLRDLAAYFQKKHGAAYASKVVNDKNASDVVGAQGVGELVYLEEEWFYKGIEGIVEPMHGNVLFIGDDECIRGSLQDKMGEKGRVIGVRNGHRYKECGEWSYELRSGETGDYKRLMEELRGRDIELDNVVYLWQGYNFVEENKELGRELNGAVYALYGLTRALMEWRPKKEIRIICVRRGRGSNPFIGGLSGFMRSVNLENPKFKYKMLTIGDDVSVDDGWRVITQELGSWGDKGVAEIKYEGCNRYEKRLQEVKIEGERKAMLKEGGVYVIAGGIGGLGLIFAKHLAKLYKAKLVLSGRRESDDKMEKELGEINRLDGEAIYVKCDVTNRAEVEELLRTGRERFGKIDGIIHAAGVLRDAFVIKKTRDDMEAVIDPKVRGAINLDAASLGDDLEVFVLFSSLAGVMGNIGQSDYAYGNRFMDNFAEWREQERKKGMRRGKTISIDWPLWEEGGMQVDEDVKRWMTQTYGTSVLPTKKGIMAFHAALQAHGNQLAVLYRAVSEKSEALESRIMGETEKVALWQKASRIFRGFVSKVVKLRPSRIASNEPHILTVRKQKKANAIRDEGIAIVGVSGRYPQARDLTEYWNNLKEGRDCIEMIPEGRWNIDNNDIVKKSIESRWGGWITDVDKFDPRFFKITPNDARQMDPQQRLFLECVYETIEDSGYTRNSILKNNSREVGVFVGVMWGEYQFLCVEGLQKGDVQVVNSTYSSIANRVSYFFNFNGPSIAVDTACSSSLTAIHMACESLRNNECQVAVAGGVNLSLHCYKYILLSKDKFLSTDGRCRSFGEGGNGYVPGEGVGAVLLKPLREAIQDGDHIYGVIRGSSINHGGKTSGFAVPNPNAQGELIMRAIERAKINPRTISYVEAHGTGTSLGDPIEIAGLVKAFSRYTLDKQFCSIGSVKSNIGHLEAASGIAALTKIILQMKYKKFVPSIHSEEINPNIIFEKTPFYLQRTYSDWQRPVLSDDGDEREWPRIAAISSFGAGGANAHVVVEEYEERIGNATSCECSDVDGEELILISGMDKEALDRNVMRLRDFIAAENSAHQSHVISLADIAYTLQVGRDHFDERVALIVQSKNELIDKLNQILNGDKNIEGAYRGNIRDYRKLDLAGDQSVEETELVATLFNDKEFHRLASYWIIGVRMDWLAFYSNAGLKRKKVSLTTYCFAREICWISENTVKNLSNEGISAGSEPKSLNYNSAMFQVKLKKSDAMIRDHVVNRKILVSGAMQIELIHAAGRLIYPNKPLLIHNVYWFRPLVVDNDYIVLELNLSPKDDHIACNVSVGAKLYSKAKISIQSEKNHDERRSLPLHEIKQRLILTIDKDVIYRRFKIRGFDYGEKYRCLRRIWFNDTEALSEIDSDSIDKELFGKYLLHPAIIDAALQSVIGISLGDVENVDKDVVTYVPYSIERINFVRIDFLQNTAYIYAKFIEVNDDRSEMRYDICLLDRQGALLDIIHNFCVKKVRKIAKKVGDVNENVDLELDDDKA